MHLFFYGVLREGVARWDFLDGLGRGVAGTTMGMLHAIPSGAKWYPALIPSQSRDAVAVRGSLHEAGAVDLLAVDEFEGPDYERRDLPIGTPDGRRTAEVYVWISELPTQAVLIPHGDFVRWLAETGNRPLCEIEDR
ncbi:MAG: gamma-glutamylcyclotransferase family protein [Pseudomonadota bacterium]